MKTIFKSLAVLFVFHLIAVEPVRAEMISGTITNHFGGDLSLWDISGTYNEDLSSLGFALNYTMVADESGKITGAGNFSYDDWSDYVGGDFSIGGNLKSAGNVVRVTLILAMNGSGYLSGYDIDFSAKAKESLELDGSSREMPGTISGTVTVSVPSLGKRKTQAMRRSETVVQLPDNVDGLWDLSMNVIPNGNTYSGSGLVQCSNGRTIDLSLTGSYSGKKDTSKLLLQGISKAVQFSILTGGSLTNEVPIQSLKGSSLGQKLQTGH